MTLLLSQRVAQLAQKDPEARRAALEHALQDAGLAYTLQSPRQSDRLCPEQNYLVKIGEQSKSCLLFCAHYDAHPGSFGANDNAAAVAILLALAERMQQQAMTAEFAFFDAEERKRAGSKLYVSELERGSVTGVINLDLCGYGDSIALLDRGHLKKAALRPFGQKELLRRHQAQTVRYLPESDDLSFRGVRVPITSIAIVPRWDLQYLNTLATYGSGFLGRPPEFEMIFSQMEVVSTIHGGFRDTPEAIEESAMQQVFAFLLDACGISART